MPTVTDPLVISVDVVALAIGPAGAPGGSDLFASLFGVLDADAALALAFGRSGWLWLHFGPPATALPYAVLTQAGGAASWESGGRWIDDVAFDLSVYAATRARARTLARQVAAAIEAADLAGTLANDESSPLYLRRAGAGLDEIDPDPGPDGGDVWRHGISFRALLGEPKS